MNNFTDWEFMLNGDGQEFRQLASDIGSGYFNIYGGIDDWLDCPNDDFRMTSLHFENETDLTAVWQIGYELVSLFNGASNLISKNYHKASIHGLIYKDRSVNFVSPQGFTGLLGKAPFTDLRIQSEYENGKKSSVKFSLIHLATENEDVYFILKYLDMEAGWVTYYKLLEAIEGFAKEKNIVLAIDKNDRASFTNTSNNFSLSGFNSRHGFKTVIKQNNTPSMSLEDGHKFVTGVAKTYINKVYFKKSTP